MFSTEWLTDDHHAPLLRVDGLTKRYGGERAIDGATFSVLQGEILGVIGPNGAGKTTLMEAVVGLLPLIPESFSGVASHCRPPGVVTCSFTCRMVCDHTRTN